MKSFASSYNWLNISAEYDNNKFGFKKPGAQNFEEMVLVDGLWTYTRLMDYINQELGVLKDSAGKEIKGVEISFDYTTLRIYLVLRNGIEMDFTNGQFRLVLGFNAGVVTGTSYADFVPDITRGIDFVYVTCDLASHTHKVGPVSEAIFGFSTRNLFISNSFSFDPPNPVWVQIRPEVIREIRLRIVDSNDEELQIMDGTNVFVILVLARRLKNRP